jgi:erythromycin esterase-like protein
MRTMTSERSLAQALRDAVYPITGSDLDFDPLLDRIGDARFVLLGEASHGTHEFYRDRAAITRRLIREKGFDAVAVEADWPDAYRASCYVQGSSQDTSADQALEGFRRFPTWMWRNKDVVDFIEWLRHHNETLPSGARRAGFYGIDLYSLHSSMEAVLRYLDSVDPEAAKRARYRYSCFEHFGEDPQAYGYAATIGLAESCEEEAVGQLMELSRRASELASRDGRVAPHSGGEAFFYAEQNARVVKNAEQYYRSMFHGRVSSWNLRDRHMAETLDALVRHLEREGRRAKVVVWAHNSHLGDARATEMGQRGELNIGQLVRERYGREAVLIGFSTYHGSVTAATDWGAPAERKRVRAALPGSYESLFHQVDIPRFTLLHGERDKATAGLRKPRLERAIGVIYRPETERVSHYFHARLPDQFDAVLHYDETRAVEPLERTSLWDQGELPETYPTGI